MMRKLFAIVFLILACSFAASAQLSRRDVLYVTGVPATCAERITVNRTTGIAYARVAGFCVEIGSWSGGTITSPLVFQGSTSGAVTVQPAAVAGTWTLTLPTSDGDANQVFTTNGAGVTSWTTPSGSDLGGVQEWGPPENELIYGDGAESNNYALVQVAARSASAMLDNSNSGSMAVAGDTLTVNGTIFTFVDSGATGNQILVGANAAAQRTNIALKINSVLGAGRAGLTSDGLGNDFVQVVASVAGLAGNSETISTTGDNLLVAYQFQNGLDAGTAKIKLSYLKTVLARI